jgi:dephospho-CoA kinase
MAMISLIQLLKEVQGKPKAIFLAGPAGSGKSYISKSIIPSDIPIINSDDTYEELLKTSGLGLKQSDFTPEQLSQASKLQSQARKSTQDKLSNAMENLSNLVIDGTGGAINPILKKKQELEALGYETLMLMIYVSPITSLKRNQERERTLMPGIVLRTWRDVNKNIDNYRQLFGSNFLLIDNDPANSEKGFNSNLLKSYIDDSKVMGKPKTPEEQAKSTAEKMQLNKEIEDMVKHIPDFNDISTSKIKINNFLTQ